MTDQTKEYIDRGEKVLMNTFDRGDKVMVKGEGSYLYDLEGNAYLDFVSGIAVNTFGHAYPKMVDTIHQQASDLIHAANMCWYIPTIEAAEKLVQASDLDQVFFANSGAEANEGAIKLARKWGAEQKGKDAYKIISFKQSFHGRTLAALKATGQEDMHQSFGPHIEGFEYCDFNQVDQLKEMVDEKTCAIFFECVQGEGGVHALSEDMADYLNYLQAEQNILLVVDEVQTGIGRTGSLFAYQQFNIKPDIMTLAKGLGGGFPTAAIMATDSVAEHFGVGDHGTTFGGNPLATAVISMVLDEIQEQDILTQVNERSQQLMEGLQAIKENTDQITDIRGRGLLIGVELVDDLSAKDLVGQLKEDYLLCNTAKGNVLRLLPPLNVSQEEVDLALQKLNHAFER